MKLEDIDELTGDIIEELYPIVAEDSDEHDYLYTKLHNFLTAWFLTRRFS